MINSNKTYLTIRGIPQFTWYYFRSFIIPQSTFELLLNNEKYFRYGSNRLTKNWLDH
jgi:hypothetical protein